MVMLMWLQSKLFSKYCWLDSFQFYSWSSPCHNPTPAIRSWSSAHPCPPLSPFLLLHCSHFFYFMNSFVSHDTVTPSHLYSALIGPGKCCDRAIHWNTCIATIQSFCPILPMSWKTHNGDAVFIQHSKVSFNQLLLYSFCYSNIWPEVEINRLTFTTHQKALAHQVYALQKEVSLVFSDHPESQRDTQDILISHQLDHHSPAQLENRWNIQWSGAWNTGKSGDKWCRTLLQWYVLQPSSSSKTLI